MQIEEARTLARDDRRHRLGARDRRAHRQSLLETSSAVSAHAAAGMQELPRNETSGPVTVFYPTESTPRIEQRGPFRLEVAAGAPPSPGNGRLVVISHGSPGSPWVHLDLVRTLVDAGFTVALPEHHADNYKDDSEPGPPSWRRRPAEVSRAIDRLGREPAFASRLDLERVGMFGMSAGGHTALTLAGGRWSPSRLRRHCQLHIAEDFHACAGPSLALNGGALDGIKRFIVTAINDRKLDDPSWYEHRDPRIIAVAAGVPFAADFDPDSLRVPRTALALITAREDRWLNPAFHSEAIAERLHHLRASRRLAPWRAWRFARPSAARGGAVGAGSRSAGIRPRGRSAQAQHGHHRVLPARAAPRRAPRKHVRPGTSLIGSGRSIRQTCTTAAPAGTPGALGERLHADTAFGP